MRASLAAVMPAPPSAVPLEVLHRALVLLGGGARLEGAQVAALAGPGVLLARVEAVAAGLELADHRRAPRSGNPGRWRRPRAALGGIGVTGEPDPEPACERCRGAGSRPSTPVRPTLGPGSRASPASRRGRHPARSGRRERRADRDGASSRDARGAAAAVARRPDGRSARARGTGP